MLLAADCNVEDGEEYKDADENRRDQLDLVEILQEIVILLLVPKVETAEEETEELHEVVMRSLGPVLEEEDEEERVELQESNHEEDLLLPVEGYLEVAGDGVLPQLHGIVHLLVDVKGVFVLIDDFLEVKVLHLVATVHVVHLQTYLLCRAHLVVNFIIFAESARIVNLGEVDGLVRYFGFQANED